MKKFISFLSFATALSFILSVFAKPYTEIFRFKTSNQIAPRTYYEKYELLTDEGFVDINCVKLDLIDNGFYFDVLKANEANKGDYVYNMVYSRKQDNPVVAINSNFFYTNTKTTYNKLWPIGVSISSSKLLSSPNNKENTFPAFVYTASNDIIFDYINSLGYKLINLDSGYEFKIAHVNKFTGDLTYPILFTGEYVKKTIGNNGYKNIEEIIIKDGVISDIRQNQPSIPLDKTDYYLAATNNYAENLKKNFKIGDRVDIKIDLSFPLEKIKAAASGNTFLIKNGEIAKFTHEIAGRHPRSAIGIDKDGRFLYFVSVDGRNGKSIGLSQAELANFLKSIGIFTAINFDGGYSTQLIAKDNDGTLKSFYSTSSTRKVFDAISAFYKYKDDKIDSLYIDCSDKVFAGEEYPVKVFAKDRFYNTIPYDPVYLKVYQDAYEIDLKQGSFVPYKSGVITIKAVYESVYNNVYNQVESEKRISVYTPEILKVYPQSLYLKIGQSVKLSFYLEDRIGHQKELLPADIKVEPCDAFEYKNGVLTAKKVFNGFVQFKYKNVLAEVPLGIGENKLLLNSFDKLSFSWVQNTSMFLSAKNKTEGKYSNKVYFNLNSIKNKKIILNFKSPVNLEGFNKITFDFSAKGCAVYLGFKDANNNTKEVALSNLSQDNFRNYTLDVNGYKKLNYILLIPQKYQGYIWIDNLAGIQVKIPPVDRLNQYVASFNPEIAKSSVIFLSNNFAKLSNDIGSKINNNLVSYKSWYRLDNYNSKFEKKDNYNIIFIKTKNNSILKFSPNQLIWLKNLLSEKKPLIFVMDIPIDELDKDEKELIVRLLKYHTSKAVIICKTNSYTHVERLDTLYVGYLGTNPLYSKTQNANINLAFDIEKGYIYLTKGY